MKKIQRSNTTVQEIKLNIFAPNNKTSLEPIKNCVVFDGEVYKVAIHGYKLNQIHKDILDIISIHGKKEISKGDNRLLDFFSLYDIQKHLGHKTKNNNSFIKSKIEELKRTTISLYDKKERETLEFNIIDVFQHSAKKNCFGIVYSPLYLMWFENQIAVDYKDYISDILRLKNAQSKALIRYLITYKNGHNIYIDNALKKIGTEMDTKRKIDYCKSNIIEDREILERLNVEFHKISSDKRKNDYTFMYKPLDKVKFWN